MPGTRDDKLFYFDGRFSKRTRRSMGKSADPNVFLFACANPKDRKGIISIKSHDSKYAVDMTFTSERAQEDYLLRIDGPQYKVTIVDNHIKSMAIYVSHEDILQLVKKK